MTELPAGAASRSRADIARDADATRAELAATIEALGKKLDVRTRARSQLGQATRALRTRLSERRPLTAVGAGLLVLGLLAALVRKVRQ